MVTLVRNYGEGRSIVARLDHGSDIIDGILSVAEAEGVSTGVFESIGALSSAELGYYDQAGRKYKSRRIDRPVEIISCIGNVSIRDDGPFIHAHAALSDSEFNMIGGHLLGGMIFAAELHMLDLSGGKAEDMVRIHDEQTGLHLWKSR